MASGPKRAEQEWLAIGGALWPGTYGDGMFDEDVMDSLLAASNRQHPDRTTAFRANNVWHMLWDTKWVDGACRMLVSDESYLAALACTKTTAHDAEDIHIPWPAFLVRFPAGFLPAGEGKWVTHARCVQVRHRGLGRDMACLMIHVDSMVHPIAVISDQDALIDILHDQTDFGDALSPDKNYGFDVDELGRSLVMAKRCILGLLFTLQHTTNWKTNGSIHATRAIGSREPPAHRAITVGRPLSVNLASSVRDVCRHGGSAPSYQTLVRGHRKRQVIGIGRTGRRVIWVDPYWRGPEGAPILARPYKVGARP